MNLIKTLLSNPHTSVAAGFYIFAKLGAGLGRIWLPQHREQFEQTANLVESVAVGYGLIMAGDASKKTEEPKP